MRRVLTIGSVALILTATFILVVRLLTVVQYFNYNFMVSLPYMFPPHWDALQAAPTRARDLFRECLTTCTIFVLIILISYLVLRFTTRFPHAAVPWQRAARRVILICVVILVATTTASLVTNRFDAGFQLPGVGTMRFSTTGLYFDSRNTGTWLGWYNRYNAPDRLEFWAYSYVDNHFTLRMPIWMLLLAILAPTITLYLASRRPLPGHCRCGYNLTGNTSGICPECGTKVNLPAPTHTRPDSAV